MKKIFSIIALALVAMTASAYDLTVGQNEHGTLSFKVGDATEFAKTATADAGQTVKVKVYGNKGWIGNGLRARAYTDYGSAKARGNMQVLDWQNVTQESDSIYTFTMPSANVELYAAYAHRALTNDMIQAIADQAWTGQAVEPALVVKDREFTLVKGTDYNVVYTGNTDKGVNTAKATISPAGTGDGFYTGEASVNYSIRKVLSSTNGFMIFPVTDPMPQYTGEAIKTQLTVTEMGVAQYVLQEGTDYEVECWNNVKAGTANYKLTGKGLYMGESEGNFFILQRDLSEDMASAMTGVVYSGNPQYPDVVITYNGKQLVRGTAENAAECDYFLTYKDNTDAGQGKATVTGVNNFKGTLNLTFQIAAKALTEDMIANIDDVTYDGNAKQPAPEVKYGDITLNAGTDYTVSYENNTGAGTATLTITSTAQNPNYSGSASKNFTIQKANVNVTATPTVKNDLVYTSQPQALLNAGTVEGGTMQYSLDGTEYAATVSTGTDAGQYKVYYKVVGDDNHNDVAAQTLDVTIGKADITTMTLAQTDPFVYNKEEQEAEVATVSAGTISVAAENFDVTGNKQTNAGTYTATVTAKQTSTNFKGSATAQWSIVEADAQIFTLELNPESFVFTGSALQPAVTVKDGDDVLTVDKDYTLAFESNIDAGTAKVTATGKGNYKLTKEATFTIQKANAQLGTAPAAQQLTYNRNAQNLVSAGAITVVGTTDESKLQYSLDGVNFSDDIPTATEAGSYTVSYYVKGDKNHNDTQPLTVECAIQKDQATMEFTNANYNLTYGDANFINELVKFGDNEVRYVSGDARVAEVQYFSGEVAIKGVGQCAITATMQEHSNFKKQEANISYTINVAAKKITADNVTVGEEGENGVPVITVSVEAPVGTLTPQEVTDYELKYYNADGQEVTAAQMNAAPGEYLAVLSFFGNYEGYVEKTITVSATPQGPIPGDVTASNVVEIDDVENFINDILEGNIPTDPGTDDFIRYDGNGDGRIDIADAQAILNLAMGLNADGTPKAGARGDNADNLQATMSIVSEDMGNGIVRYAMNVEGNFSYTGFQADVVTSGSIMNVALASDAMPMRSNTMKNGALRVLGLPGSTELQADGTVMYVYVQGGNGISFENVVMTTAQSRSIEVGGETTGLMTIENGKLTIDNCYDLSGRKVNGAHKGIVIVAGKKLLKK